MQISLQLQNSFCKSQQTISHTLLKGNVVSTMDKIVKIQESNPHGVWQKMLVITCQLGQKFGASIKKKQNRMVNKGKHIGRP